MNSANPRRVLLPAVRCTTEERDEIRRLAAAARLTVSEYVRRKALGGRASMRTQ